MIDDERVEIRSCADKSKGRGLFLKNSFNHPDTGDIVKKLEGGQLLMRDSPTVAIQSHEDEYVALSCSSCSRYIGSLDDQMKLSKGEISLSDAIKRLQDPSMVSVFPKLENHFGGMLTSRHGVCPIISSRQSLQEFSVVCSPVCADTHATTYSFLKSAPSVFEEIVQLSDSKAKNRFLLMLAVLLSATVGNASRLYDEAKTNPAQGAAERAAVTIEGCLDVCWSQVRELVKKPYWEVCRSVLGPVSRLQNIEEIEDKKERKKAIAENAKWEAEMKADAKELRRLLIKLCETVLDTHERIADVVGAPSKRSAADAAAPAGNAKLTECKHDASPVCCGTKGCSHEDDRHSKRSRLSEHIKHASGDCCGKPEACERERGCASAASSVVGGCCGKPSSTCCGSLPANAVMVRRCVPVESELRKEMLEWIFRNVLPSEEMVSELLGALCLNVIDVRFSNPIVPYLMELDEQLQAGVENAKAALNVIGADLEVVAQLRAKKEEEEEQEEETEEEEDEEDSENGSEEESDEDSEDEEDEIVFDFSAHRQTLPAFTSEAFSHFHGFALYPVVAALNHSCDPSLEVCYMTGDNNPVLQTRRAIKGGEELSISYVDVNADLDERRRELFGYGFVCSCERCIREEEEEETDDESD